MKRTIGIATFVLFAVIVMGGCGDDDNFGTGNSTQNPAPPALSANQIDRMGRPGINTAVTNPFFRETVPAEKDMHEAILDEYNAAADSAQWRTMFSTELEGNLAILDSLDTVCGNQLLASQTPPQPRTGRYEPLAAVLADDALYVNTASGACQQYLAVEANFIGIHNTDCGGRTPLEDTIDTTYSLLAAGTLTGVTDGIAKDNDGTASLTVFPFLAAPF